MAWQTAGVAALVWKANPDACPLCKELDGKRVPTRSYFLTEATLSGLAQISSSSVSQLVAAIARGVF